MALELEALLNNRNAVATIILPPLQPGVSRPRPIKGIITNASFEVGGSNTFADGMPDAAKSILDTIGEGFRTSGIMSGGNVVNRQTVSGLSTIKTWQSSADFVFGLDLTFIAIQSKEVKDIISGTDNVLLPCIELLSLVYPSGVDQLLGDDSGLLFNYLAPNGYSIAGPYNPSLDENKQPVTGVVQIAIGNWLRLRNMVCNNVSCSFSREIQTNGTPLTATVSMEFAPFHTYRYKDIIDIFNSNPSVNILNDIQNLANEQAKVTVSAKTGFEQGVSDLAKKVVDAVKSAGNPTATSDAGTGTP